MPLTIDKVNDFSKLLRDHNKKVQGFLKQDEIAYNATGKLKKKNRACQIHHVQGSFTCLSVYEKSHPTSVLLYAFSEKILAIKDLRKQIWWCYGSDKDEKLEVTTYWRNEQVGEEFGVLSLVLAAELVVNDKSLGKSSKNMYDVNHVSIWIDSCLFAKKILPMNPSMFTADDMGCNVLTVTLPRQDVPGLPPLASAQPKRTDSFSKMIRIGVTRSNSTLSRASSVSGRTMAPSSALPAKLSPALSTEVAEQKTQTTEPNAPHTEHPTEPASSQIGEQNMSPHIIPHIEVYPDNLSDNMTLSNTGISPGPSPKEVPTFEEIALKEWTGMIREWKNDPGWPSLKNLREAVNVWCERANQRAKELGPTAPDKDRLAGLKSLDSSYIPLDLDPTATFCCQIHNITRTDFVYSLWDKEKSQGSKPVIKLYDPCASLRDFKLTDRIKEQLWNCYGGNNAAITIIRMPLQAVPSDTTSTSYYSAVLAMACAADTVFIKPKDPCLTNYNAPGLQGWVGTCLRDLCGPSTSALASPKKSNPKSGPTPYDITKTEVTEIKKRAEERYDLFEYFQNPLPLSASGTPPPHDDVMQHIRTTEERGPKVKRGDRTSLVSSVADQNTSKGPKKSVKGSNESASHCYMDAGKGIIMWENMSVTTGNDAHVDQALEADYSSQPPQNLGYPASFRIWFRLYERAGLSQNNMKEERGRPWVYVCVTEKMAKIMAEISGHKKVLLSSSPGFGKSTTALIEALIRVTEGHSLLWIHLNRARDDHRSMLVKFKANDLTAFSHAEVSIKDIETVLEGHADGPYSQFMGSISQYCRQSHESGNSKVRYRFVTSSPGYLSYNSSGIHRIEMWAPHLKEYYTAVENPHFLAFVWDDLVKDFAYSEPNDLQAAYYTSLFDQYEDQDFDQTADLDGINLLPTSKNAKKLIFCKFEYAGMSWRYMFFTTLEKIKTDIRAAVENISTKQCEEYLLNPPGHYNTATKHSLFCRTDETDSGTLVSSYAKQLMSYKAGPAALKNIKKLLGRDMKPTMKGDFFELMFFATIKSYSIAVRLRGADEKVKENWDRTWRGPIYEAQCHSGMFDGIFVPGGHEDQWDAATKSSPFWIRPTMPNNPGFDAVFINYPEGLVRFVQVTRAKKHSFEGGHYLSFGRKLAERFKKADRYIKKAEICYLLNNDAAIKNMPTNTDLRDTRSGQIAQNYPFPLNKNTNEPIVEIAPYVLRLDPEPLDRNEQIRQSFHRKTSSTVISDVSEQAVKRLAVDKIKVHFVQNGFLDALMRCSRLKGYDTKGDRWSNFSSHVYRLLHNPEVVGLLEQKGIGNSERTPHEICTWWLTKERIMEDYETMAVVASHVLALDITIHVPQKDQLLYKKTFYYDSETNPSEESLHIFCDEKTDSYGAVIHPEDVPMEPPAVEPMEDEEET
ncbi:uncharacterized protein LOC129598861 isoform X2 [Paramacrobiotus metropolitanus]|uniref:uncharacterized protein LOC129598861 isoform X2 n=1 Tax=Paramacrobiotus metropolitanus TaxID=2943436 RepID=UPI0024460A0F|nr:uncharacterized protein LOC129598861 isoform X2 [Paramacrobiotus metropolitanus]